MAARTAATIAARLCQAAALELGKLAQQKPRDDRIAGGRGVAVLVGDEPIVQPGRGKAEDRRRARRHAAPAHAGHGLVDEGGNTLEAAARNRFARAHVRPQDHERHVGPQLVNALEVSGDLSRNNTLVAAPIAIVGAQRHDHERRRRNAAGQRAHRAFLKHLRPHALVHERKPQLAGHDRRPGKRRVSRREALGHGVSQHKQRASGGVPDRPHKRAVAGNAPQLTAPKCR